MLSERLAGRATVPDGHGVPWNCGITNDEATPDEHAAVAVPAATMVAKGHTECTLIQQMVESQTLCLLYLAQQHTPLPQPALDPKSPAGGASKLWHGLHST